MLFTIGSALLTLASLAYAAPGSIIDRRQEFEAGITFIGAGPNPPTYFQAFPTDDNIHLISKFPLARSPSREVGERSYNCFATAKFVWTVSGSEASTDNTHRQSLERL